VGAGARRLIAEERELSGAGRTAEEHAPLAAGGVSTVA
jgi:hypothetical protein